MGKRLLKMEKNEQDFMAMLARCERIVFKICLVFTDRQPDSVRDLYQDIVCNLWQGWGRMRGDSTEGTWVYRVALPVIVRLSDEMIATLADTRREDLYDKLYRLIDRLDDTDKSLILLYLDNIPSRQIAIITGVGEATARKRIERIKQKLIKLNEQDNGSIF